MRRGNIDPGMTDEQIVEMYARIGMCYGHGKGILDCGCERSAAYIQSAYDENDARDFNASQVAELPDSFETPAAGDPDEADHAAEAAYARDGY